MNLHRAFGVVLTVGIMAATSLYAPPATSGTKSTDQSDIWWVHTESGWGIQFVQNNNTIFATLFVYGPDNQPTWYTATLNFQGGLSWSGTLYKTTGPWFGVASFDPTAVKVTPVGTMSLNSARINSDILTYTINGVSVLKTVERQLLAYEDFNGEFAGVMGQQATGQACNPADNFDAASTTTQITQNSNAMTVVITAHGDTCTFPGTYSQTGHFGHVEGSYLCTSGSTGTFDFFEMVRTHADMRARMTLTRGGCTIKGRLVGLEQPLPPQ